MNTITMIIISVLILALLILVVKVGKSLQAKSKRDAIRLGSSLVDQIRQHKRHSDKEALGKMTQIIKLVIYNKLSPAEIGLESGQIGIDGMTEFKHYALAEFRKYRKQFTIEHKKIHDELHRLSIGRVEELTREGKNPELAYINSLKEMKRLEKEEDDFILNYMDGEESMDLSNPLPA